ncbi:MAG: family 78 glycoside hydrolase catalytic domain [Kiritimatiellae bacterium]|nr:family 78 glycoside hydrolase catalytic domain [Kiritimatiellia bacterium]
MRRMVVGMMAAVCSLAAWGQADRVETIPLKVAQQVVASVKPADPGVFNGAKWLWHGEAKTAKGAVAFRADLDLPAGAVVEDAWLAFTCDNGARIRINGQEVAVQVTDEDSWRALKRVEGLGKFLKGGRNAVTAICENHTEGFAGFVAVIEAKLRGGQTVRLATDDATWQVTRNGGAFVKPAALGVFGCQPWGNFANAGGAAYEMVASSATFELKSFGPTAALFFVADSLAGNALALRLNGQTVGRPVSGGGAVRIDITEAAKSGLNTLEWGPYRAVNPRLSLDNGDGAVFISTARPPSRETCDSSAFVKSFVNAKAVTKAVWRTTGLGVYEAYVNGTEVGGFLKPGFTHVEKRRIERVTDVTTMLNRAAGAKNVLAAIVTQGWWRDQITGRRGKESAFRGRLELTYADGTREVIGTDPSWLSAHAGRVRSAAIFDGEQYDARVDMGWLTSGEPGDGFAASRVNREFAGEIVDEPGADVKVRRDLTLSPVEAYVWKGTTGGEPNKAYGKVVVIRRYQPGEPMKVAPGEELIIDFGQNAAAEPEMALTAAAGTKVTVKTAEVLNDGNGLNSRGNDGPEGSLYRRNLRRAASRIEYTCRGGGVETYMPTFTFFGYRYVAVTADGDVTISSLKSVPVTSIAKEDEIGTIKTGNALVNKLISNVRWGMYSNYLSVPTDCPQRDERLGWTADTQVFTMAASYQADVRGFFRKWMADVCQTQHDNGAFTGVAPIAQYGSESIGFGWSDAGIIVPYVIWTQFGDTEVIRDSWDSMKKYMAFVAKDRWLNVGHQWADWLSYESAGRAQPLNCRFIGGCYWLWDARMMVEMAEAIGKPDDAAAYRKMAGEALAYLRETFIRPDGQLPQELRHMQTPALFALKLGLFKDEAAAKVAHEALMKNFADHGDCLQTGFLGTSILTDTLSEIGEDAMAYTLLLQRKNPSWLYSVDQGATTIWERWNSYTKESGFGNAGMNSFNHYAYGAVLGWMYASMAGIKADSKAPGFKHFFLAPKPDRRVGFVECTYRSASGLIASAWKYGDDGTCTWTYTIPKGTTATVRVPGGATVERGPGTYTEKIGK